MQQDTRNVIDTYRNWSEAAIVADLDTNGVELEIAIENLERDFNMGTIVRSANAFGVRHVHVIGRRQWNKRGAMKTDAYLHVHYHATVDEFYAAMQERGRIVVAVDIIPGARGLHEVSLPKNAVLVFGAEGPGISPELSSRAESVVMIEQLGSTRSVNVGVAAGIVMYAWMQQYVLGDNDGAIDFCR